MSDSLIDHIKKSIATSKQYNSSQVTPPNVILWPDPESQWLSIVGLLRKEIPAFLTLGIFQPKLKQGPSIWIKCMVSQTLPEADWDNEAIPIIYMPGVSKADFKKIEEAPTSLQPLMEYQFTGNLWTQENGKEWTILAFIQNVEQGMGLEVSRDNATKDALVKSLPAIVNEGKSFFRNKVDADFLNQLLVPQVIPNLLKWIEKGKDAIAHLGLDQQEAFEDVVRSQYRLNLDYSLVLDFVKQIGMQKDPWNKVWQYFANAPHKYPKLISYLEQATPDDLGEGIFNLPEESWPPINKEREKEVAKAIMKLKKKAIPIALKEIEQLTNEHKHRLQWIWTEMGQSPFAAALPSIIHLAKLSLKAYDNSSVDKLSAYYVKEGIHIDKSLRALYLISDTKAFKDALQVIVNLFYKPWLEKLTRRFQELVADDVTTIVDLNSAQLIAESDFVLFVDAFRYDIAIDFVEQLSNRFKIKTKQSWSALPSLTPSSKPSVSPVVAMLNKTSGIKNFQPQFETGDACTPHYFKKALSTQNIKFIGSASEIDDPSKRYWMEIGDIDKKGHQEQSAMFLRIPKLLTELKDTIQRIANKGVKRITLVTDHGWLLLPGGLPKASLHRDLAETRWGRCAELKEGTTTDLLQLPWTWNPNQHIAYAPGISFFKKNEEYAHGGISIQECLTPLLTIEVLSTTKAKKALLESFKWIGLRLQIKTSGTSDDYSIDVRTKRDDKGSSVIIGTPKFEEDKWKVMIDSDYEGQACTLLLIDASGVILEF